MAKVFGETGRYARQQAVQRRHRIWTSALVSCCIFSGICGLMAAMSVPRASIPALLGVGISAALVSASVALGWWSTKKLDALEKERMYLQRGATGEALVSAILQNFPDEFYVTNNLTTPFGDLDHVVVGPTGVFVLDTKNWRGVVAPDGRGELLLNDKPTEKRFINGFIARMMKVKDQVDVLARDHGAYFQPVLVFTSARVEADWGTTGKVHCIREDQLFEYIVQSSHARTLSTDQVKRITQALLGLAHMDADFTKHAVQPSPRWQPRGATTPLPGLKPAMAVK